MSIFSPHLDDEDIIFLGIGEGVIFFQDGVPMWRGFIRIPRDQEFIFSFKEERFLEKASLVHINFQGRILLFGDDGGGITEIIEINFFHLMESGVMGTNFNSIFMQV
jgi:hypothetical protein